MRALFEPQVRVGARTDNPVPAPRRGQGLRPRRAARWDTWGRGAPRAGGRLVRQAKRLPEALEPDEVAAFLADLRSYRDRAVVLLMLLGGLRAGEVRRLRLADVDEGLRRVRVVGKGNRERTVPVVSGFFVELAPTCVWNARLDWPRPSALSCCRE